MFHPRASGKWELEEIPLPPGCGTGKGVGIGDLDGDGDLDLAFTCENAKGDLSGVRWLEFTGDPKRRWQDHEISGPQGVKFDRLELLDLDGDGDLDLLRQFPRWFFWHFENLVKLGHLSEEMFTVQERSPLHNFILEVAYQKVQDLRPR